MIFNLSYSNKSNANLVYVSLKTYRGATLQNKIIMIIIFYNNNDYRHTTWHFKIYLWSFLAKLQAPVLVR